MKLYDTNLPAMYSKVLYEEKNADLAPEHTDKIIDVTFIATATFLNVVKKKNQPAALTFKSLDKTVVAAGIIQYFENSDKKKPGNWNLTFTFDENDIPKDAQVYDLSDPQIHPYFRSTAGEKYHFSYTNPETLINLPVTVFEQIKKWLDENAKENEEVSIEQDGVFQARVAVEGGEKVFAIEPAGEIKVLIKDDAAIEK